MKKSSLITSLLVALGLALVPACKKENKKTEEMPATGDQAGKPADTMGTQPSTGAAPSEPSAGTPGAAPTEPSAGGAAGAAPAEPSAGGATGAEPAAGGEKKDEAAGAGGATEPSKDESAGEKKQKAAEGGW